MLSARLEPSIGSVPEPNSSTNIRLSGVAVFTICTIFFIWEENVLSDSRILCSSPMSANIWSKTYIELASDAGMCNPLIAIVVSKPTVFNVTVFPPVFGPVINRVEKSFPISIELAIADCGSNNGWIAFSSLIIFLLLIFGQFAFIVLAYLALANMKSSKPIKL